MADMKKLLESISKFSEAVPPPGDPLWDLPPAERIKQQQARMAADSKADAEVWTKGLKVHEPTKPVSQKKFVGDVHHQVDEASEYDVDSMLEHLTNAYQGLLSGNAVGDNGRIALTTVYNMLRSALVKGDNAEYNRMLEYVASKYPDATDLLLGDIQGDDMTIAEGSEPQFHAVTSKKYVAYTGSKSQVEDYIKRNSGGADGELHIAPMKKPKKKTTESDDSALTEELRVAFEDYVKNKAAPEDEKTRVTITYKDGHTQTKLVTEKERKRYETADSVEKVVDAKGGKGRLDDTKLSEGFGRTYAEVVAQNLPKGLDDENEILDYAYEYIRDNKGIKAARNLLHYTEDFSGDVVTAYNWLEQGGRNHIEESAVVTESRMDDLKDAAKRYKKDGSMQLYHKTMEKYFDARASSAGIMDQKRFNDLADKHYRLAKDATNEGKKTSFELGSNKLNESASVDMKGKKCPKCKKDTFQERSQHDDMQGQVTCSCGNRVDRHQTVAQKPKTLNAGPGIDEGFVDSIKKFAKANGPHAMSRREEAYAKGKEKAIDAITSPDREGFRKHARNASRYHKVGNVGAGFHRGFDFRDMDKVMDEGEITEGTWSSPKTPEEIATLRKVLSNPLPAGKAQDILYHILGDDDLFDFIAELEQDGLDDDVSQVIRIWLKRNMPEIHQKLHAQPSGVTEANGRLGDWTLTVHSKYGEYVFSNYYNYREQADSAADKYRKDGNKIQIKYTGKVNEAKAPKKETASFGKRDFKWWKESVEREGYEMRQAGHLPGSYNAFDGEKVVGYFRSEHDVPNGTIDYGKLRITSSLEETTTYSSYSAPGPDPKKFPDRSHEGLKGPWYTRRTGDVVYFDTKENMYYDPESNLYISDHEYEAMNEAKGPSKQQAKDNDAEWAKIEAHWQKVKGQHVAIPGGPAGDQIKRQRAVKDKVVDESKQDLTSMSTERLKAYVAKVSGGGVPAFGGGAQLKRVKAELARREQQPVDESKGKSENRALWDKINSKGVVPSIDRERYTDLSHEGLEGPFRMKTGQVLYYDPKEGKYYNRDTDMYVGQEEMDEINRYGLAEDQVTELSDKTLSSYKDKAVASIIPTITKGGNIPKAAKHAKGSGLASSKLEKIAKMRAMLEKLQGAVQAAKGDLGTDQIEEDTPIDQLVANTAPNGTQAASAPTTATPATSTQASKPASGATAPAPAPAVAPTAPGNVDAAKATAEVVKAVSDPAVANKIATNPQAAKALGAVMGIKPK